MQKIKAKNLMVFLLIIAWISVSGQKIQGYALFSEKGKKTSFEKILKEVAEADIVYFGEIHNDPIAHWLQLELVMALSKKRPLVIGAEMFEADNQAALDEYLSGQIDVDSFQKAARLWSNYSTDYAKVVDYAKKDGIKVVATNIPRKYARMVFYDGFQALDTLTASEKRWIAPLPVAYDPEVPCYRNMLQMDMGGHEADENFPKAQAIKDATMSYFILKNRKADGLFLHLNGSYHSDNKEGIVWYTSRNNPQLIQKTITTVYQKDLSALDESNKGKADFIICVDEDMTTTY